MPTFKNTFYDVIHDPFAHAFYKKGQKNFSFLLMFIISCVDKLYLLSLVFVSM